MIKRIYLLLLVLLFATSGAYAQVRTLTIGEVEAGPGTVLVPVSLLNFTNLDGFQLSITYDPAILTPVSIENRFVSGGNRIWDLSVGDGELVVFFMDFNLQSHSLNGKAFDIKFQYSGAFSSDVEFNLSNTEVMINNVMVNNNILTFVNGSVTPDPSIISGTISMDTVDDVILGSVVEMPVYLEGDGFNTVAALNLEVGFNPLQLLYEGVDVMPGVDIAFTVNEDDGTVILAWAGAAQDFTTKTHIANIRFTYNAVAEAAVVFLPGTEISTAVGPLPYTAVDGLVIPRELDAKITIPDVYQFSGVDVAIPISLSGIDAGFPDAGSITLRLAYDGDLMTYGGYTSTYGDNWTVGTSTDDLLVLTLFNIEGIELNNNTLITLNFNFTAPGTSSLTFVDGSSFVTPSGAFIPFTFVNGSVKVTVPGNVYNALLDARTKTGLVLTNPDVNEVLATVTYPASFIVEDQLGFPVLTDDWKLDADIRSSHAIPAGSVITISSAGLEFEVAIEEEVAAGEVMYLSDMILAANADAIVRTSLLGHAGLTLAWLIDIRSPLTYETTFSVAVVTANDGFVDAEDGEHAGFVLAEDEIDITVHGDPQLLFAFNGELAVTGSEFEFCYDVPLTVTLADKLEGGDSFDITYTVNDEEFLAEGVEVGGVLYGPELLEAGTYVVVVTSIVDNFGRDVVNPEDIYYATVVINQMPEAAITVEGELEFCDGGSVLLTATESVEYLWSNGETTQNITVTESGVFTVTVTDANGCVNTSDEVEVTVNPLPVAEISVAGELVFCTGGSVVLTASEAASYLWSNNATTRSITVNASGTFSVVVTDANGCSATSDQVVVLVHALPVVTCPGDTIVMLSHPAFALSGATPAGGTYSGAGVSNGMFNANTATVGDHTITYTYTNTNGCTAVCTFVITVKLDTSVPVKSETAIKLYPNPARTFVTIEANDEIQEIRMVDMLGQVVFTDVVQHRSYELNVSAFKSGIYFVQVLTEKGFTTHRVQVTR